MFVINEAVTQPFLAETLSLITRCFRLALTRTVLLELPADWELAGPISLCDETATEAAKTSVGN